MSAAIEVRKNERGAWCVYIDGQFVSDHRSHDGARYAAIAHQHVARRGNDG